MNYQSSLRRHGTMANIRMITDQLDARVRTAIDIGCDAGAYSAHLANLGVKVDAFDPDDSAVGEAREFFSSNRSPVKLTHQLFTLDDVRKMPVYDVSLLLSVYHQIVEHNGLEYGNEYLVELYRKTRHQLFFQSCMIHLKHRRKMPFIENHTPSILEYFVSVLRSSGQPVHARMLGYSQNNLPAAEPFRPLFLFEKSATRSVFTLPSMERGGFEGGSASNLVCVDLDRTVSDQTLTSFSPEGWHPFTDVCRHLVDGKAWRASGQSLGTDARESLNTYYDRFQPATFGAIWRAAGLDSDIGVLAAQPTGHYCNWLPWNPPTESLADMQAGRTQATVCPPNDAHTYGPFPADARQKEMTRLQGVTEKMRLTGYEPEINHDGYIRGQLMVRGEDSRFLVLAGQHRIAALAAVGYRQVMARFQPDRAKLIDLAQVKSWPLVANGTYTAAQATNIFNGIFEANGLAVRDAIRTRAGITLPPVETYRVAANRNNGWSDQYGALHVAAAYAGVSLKPNYQMGAIWQHGCEGPWMDFSPDLLGNNTPGAREKFVLVAREDQAALLRGAGYTEAHAIGLPIAYTQPSGLPRIPRSLLVMPTHTLTGEQVQNRTAFEKYAEEVKAVAGNFDRVTICIHPSCRTNGLWVKEFTARGFDIVYGAQNTDLNALTRMRALFEQFETVTTNGWGSHVAYALAFGAKVAIHGTQPKRTEADYLRDATWAADPAALRKWLSDETTGRERQFLAPYCQTPMQAVADVEAGRSLIGWGHRVSPEQMAQLLGVILSSPVSTARQARQEIREQARVLVGSGAKADAVQLLLAAAKTDVASKDAGIILESLIEIGQDLAPLEPKQSAYLLGEAEKMAKARGLTLEAVQARLVAA